MELNELPVEAIARQRNANRFCGSPDRCRRGEDRVDGFGDPRARDALLRWCSLCRKLVVTGRG
jgi:hypothetical protein